MNTESVIKLLRRECKEAGGQHPWAREHGLSQTTVSLMLNERIEPQPKILDALGLERVVSYRKVAGWPLARGADQFGIIRDHMGQEPIT